MEFGLEKMVILITNLLELRPSLLPGGHQGELQEKNSTVSSGAALSPTPHVPATTQLNHYTTTEQFLTLKYH